MNKNFQIVYWFFTLLILWNCWSLDNSTKMNVWFPDFGHIFFIVLEDNVLWSNSSFIILHISYKQINFMISVMKDFWIWEKCKLLSNFNEGLEVWNKCSIMLVMCILIIHSWEIKEIPLVYNKPNVDHILLKNIWTYAMLNYVNNLPFLKIMTWPHFVLCILLWLITAFQQCYLVLFLA